MSASHRLGRPQDVGQGLGEGGIGSDRLGEEVLDHRAIPLRFLLELGQGAFGLVVLRRDGLTSRQFIRYVLLRPNLGHDLTTLTYGGKPRGLAPVDEILALFPELAPPA